MNYPEIADLPIVRESLSFITPPEVTLQVITDAIAAGLKRIWMQPGAEDEQASQSARVAGINVIDDGHCMHGAIGPPPVNGDRDHATRRIM
ncbi:hypothetical protein Poly59_57620 [Rubripirellula reticaptiva]|uniref:CoA-binding domain-containing protein n=1 Tax=Rubripirellula reticaptiva TaxID=2528013 RepID=A0A5C6EHU4_9BACT|nr:hypothetical protein Poly59_57620 [Rubripirellula reticaptiva]